MTSRAKWIGCALAMASLFFGGTAFAADEPARAEPRPEPAFGALSPRAAKFVVAPSAGMFVVIPHVTLDGRVGVGRGLSIDARYRNVGVLGHHGAAGVAWGMRVTSGLAFGAAFRGSYSSLALADGGVIGIQFSALEAANSATAGHDLVLTFLRGESASVTLRAGPTYQLAATRYTGFDESAFVFDPRLRSIDASVMGEWPYGPLKSTVFLALEGAFLLTTEIRPFGFLPTGIVGFAWRG
jgi:hypothetical protein